MIWRASETIFSRFKTTDLSSKGLCQYLTVCETLIDSERRQFEESPMVRSGEVSPLGQMGFHLASAASQAHAWTAAAVAVLLRALVPTPSEAVAVAALVGLCGLAEGLEGLAAWKDGRKQNRRELLDSVWRVLAYLAVPALLGLMQLTFPGAEAVWDGALWGAAALFASREGASCSRSLALLGAPLPSRILTLIRGPQAEEQTKGEDADA